jgi:hypothetical protein
MNRIIIILGVIGMFFSCKKEHNEIIEIKETKEIIEIKGIPYCLNEMINVVMERPVGNPPIKVYSYTYHKMKVYYSPPSCCDIPSTLIDTNCNFLCHPDGYITGGGDGLCTDFLSTKINEKLVWEDPR